MSRHTPLWNGLELGYWHDGREVTSPLRYTSAVNATDSPAETYTLRRARRQLGGPPQIPQKSPRKPQPPPDRASYKLYYVNYEIELNPRPSHTPLRRADPRLLPVSYFLSADFADFSCASS